MATRSPAAPLLFLALSGLLGGYAACGGTGSGDEAAHAGSAGAGGSGSAGRGTHAGNSATSQSGEAGNVTAGTSGDPAGAGGAQNQGGRGATGGAGESGAGESGAGESGASAIAGAGGSPPECLDPVYTNNVFTIADPAFCVVAIYEAGETSGRNRPLWGRHGGPLTVTPDATGGGVTLVRWTAPTGVMGAMTKQTTHVDSVLPQGTVIGFHAVDLPFFGWTAVSWHDPATLKGEIVAIQGTSVAQRFALHNPGDVGGVADGVNGRLLYLALSAIGNPLGNVNGLYEADACSLPMPGLGTGTGCAAPGPVAGWGDSDVALAIDNDGNVFAINQSLTLGTQEARGYAASLVKRGAPSNLGATLFTLPGFGVSLAALAPHASTPGTLVFQPFSPTTFYALDVVELDYTVAGVVMATAPQPKTLLRITSKNQTLKLVADDQDRLWVAVSQLASTQFIVLQRKSP